MTKPLALSRQLKFAVVVLTCVSAGALGGCARSAANMAATQPEAKDLSVLTKGTPRDKVIARIGAPETTTPTGNLTVDVYRFVQGYSAGARTARVFTHSTLSIATLGLWEVAGTAIEGYARGNEVSIRIIYDEHDQLRDYMILDGAESLDIPVTASADAKNNPTQGETKSSPPSISPSNSTQIATSALQ